MTSTNLFNDLFEKIISLWPDSLVVSEKIIHKNGGATIPALISVHDTIEEQICVLEDNHMLRHMDWAIYTALHQLATKHDAITPRRDIDREVVRRVFEQNLK